jgi:hypothetical protein
VDYELVVERHDVRAPDPRHGGHDPHAVKPATERDLAAVRAAASLREQRGEVGLSGEMAAKPWLALSEEVDGLTLTVASSGSGCRDGHDDPPVGVDDDAQATGTRRVTEGERERTAR